MRLNKWTYAGLLVATPILLYLAGPRASGEYEVREPNLPDDLDDYVRSSEARFKDITPGTEKKIVWADPDRKARTTISNLYLHGFSASRQEVAPLCDRLSAELGANLFYARLKGHGRPGEHLGDATVGDWINDAVEALAIGRRLGERVVLVGTSTGATLSTWLTAGPRATDVAASVMISPNFAPADRNARVALWPWGRQILRAAVGRERVWQPHNERQAQYWTTSYPVDALVTMMALVREVERLDLGRVSVPTLVVYSEDDTVISVDHIHERFGDLGAELKELVAVDTTDAPSSHVIAGDIVSPGTTDRVAGIISEFLDRALGATPNGSDTTDQSSEGTGMSASEARKTATPAP